MNVTSTFAVAIDPTQARSGAKEAVEAAKDMGEGMKREGAKFEAAAGKAGQAGKRAGEEIKDGAEKAENAVEKLGKSRGFDAIRRAAAGAMGGIGSSLGDIANATGLLNGPLGGVIGRLDSFSRIVSSFKRGLGDISGTARSAGTALEGVGAGGQSGAAGLAAMALAAGPLAGLLVGVTAAVGGLALGITALVHGIGEAGQFEAMENQLAVLLGSFDKAEARIQEITELALKTPFAMKELTEGNRILETFTAGALSGRDAMLTIGDAAAGAGRNFAEVAMWTGRMYASLKGGQPIGEATMRLLEMGILLPQTKAKMDAMAESSNKGGKNFAQIWGMAEQSLKRFDGAMLVQSTSWQGLISSLEDSWSVFTASLGKPVMDSLKPALQEAIDFLGGQNDLGSRIGETIAGKIRGITAMLASGNFWEGMARNMWATLAVGLVDFVGKLGAGIQTAGQYLIFAAENFVEWIAQLGTGEYWASMGVQLENAAKGFANWLIDGAQNAVNLITSKVPAMMGGGKVDYSASKFTLSEVPGYSVPDIFSGNNTAFDFSDKFAANADNMEAIFQDTEDYWTKWADDWNKLELEPVSAKLQKPFDKSAMKLPDPASMANMQNVEDDPTVKKAKAVREKAAKDQRGEFQRLLDDWRNVAKEIDQVNAGIARSMSDHISGALTSWITGAKSAKDAFNDMAMGIVNDIVAMTVKMLVQYALAQALGWVTGGVAPTVGVAHSGGTVGDTLGTRQVGTKTFTGAKRYAHGGTVQGVGSGEVPIIAEPGEKVLTRTQQGDIKDKIARAEGKQEKATGTTIINVRDPNEIASFLARNPNAVLNVIAEHATTIRNIVNQPR